MPILDFFIASLILAEILSIFRKVLRMRFLLRCFLAAPLLLVLPRPPIHAALVPLRAPALLAGAQSRIFHLRNLCVADCRTDADSKYFHFLADF